MSTHTTQQDTVDSQQNQVHIGYFYFYTFNTEKTGIFMGLILPLEHKTFKDRGNLSVHSFTISNLQGHVLETDPVHGTADTVVVQKLFNGT